VGNTERTWKTPAVGGLLRAPTDSSGLGKGRVVLIERSRTMSLLPLPATFKYALGRSDSGNGSRTPDP